MSTITRLALRNLLRNPRRTVLTAIAVFAGVAIAIIGRGFIGGVTEGIVVAATDGTVGHVMARPAGYPTLGGQHPVSELLDVGAEARKLLDEESVGWTERLYFAPTVTHGAESMRVVAIGLDPDRDPKVFPRDRWHVEGALPREGTSEIAVSPRLAQLLGAKIGDRLVLQVRTHPGAINALEVELSGLVRTGNMALDGRTLQAPMSLARTLLAADAPSHLSVRLKNRDHAAAFAGRLSQALGSRAEVVTWQSETEELIRLQEVRRKSLDMVVFILLALAAFGITNTILMAAYERIREVGTLRSLGMTERGVVRLFLFEGALIGLVGGVLGALAGGGLVSWWARHPIDFSQMMEKQLSSGISAPALIYTRFEPATLLVAVVLGIVVATLASIYPARVASRMVPADAVRAS